MRKGSTYAGYYGPRTVHPQVIEEIGTPVFAYRLAETRRELLADALVDLGWSARDAAAYLGGIDLGELPEARALVNVRVREIRCQHFLERSEALA